MMKQLSAMGADDEKFAARFTVLCEYVTHHVKEEETELFPQLQSARLDWESIATGMRERRAELAPDESEGMSAEAETETAMAGEGSDTGARAKPQA